MMNRKAAKLLAFSFIFQVFVLNSFSQVPKPAEHFGYEPGTDRMLFKYEALIDYLIILDEASPMLRMVNIGTSLFFAEISGSAVADVAALGSILIPSMKKKGYPGESLLV